MIVCRVKNEIVVEAFEVSEKYKIKENEYVLTKKPDKKINDDEINILRFINGEIVYETIKRNKVV